MSTATARPAIDRALAIRDEVLNADWPQGRDAQASVRWKLGELTGILATRDRLVNGDMDPLEVCAPDMGCSWDLERALEYVDDEALQCAEGLRKRLAEGLRDEQRREAANGGKRT